MAETLHDLGLVLHDEGKGAEAETYLRDALALRIRILAGDHPDVAVSRRELGALLARTQRFEEAEEMLLESHRIASERLGPRDRNLLGGLDKLVKLYDGWGRPADAERYRRLRPS